MSLKVGDTVVHSFFWEINIYKPWTVQRIKENGNLILVLETKKWTEIPKSIAHQYITIQSMQLKYPERFL